MAVETPDIATPEVDPSVPPKISTVDDALNSSDAIVAIGNDVLSNGHSESSNPSAPATPSTDSEDKFSFRDTDDAEDVFQDAMDDLPATRKLHQRLSTYSPQVRETAEWEQIMQDWDRVMAEKRIQDAKLNLVEQENKRMKAQLVEAESSKLELEKESQERIEALEKSNRELTAKTKDPAKERQALVNQLEEAEAEKELFKLMLEETEGEKKRIELKLVQSDKEKDLWAQKSEKVKALKNRLRLKAAQFQLLSTSTSSLLQGMDGARPDKERKRLIDQVNSLESDRSRLAAMVKNTMSSEDHGYSSNLDTSSLSNKELVDENKRLHQRLEMSQVECSLLQRRIEAFEVTLHDVRVALTNSEAHAESLEMKKYDLQDKLAAAEGSLDRARIESTKYQALHKEMLEKNDCLAREMQVVKARFEAKDRVLITTQKQLTAAKADGGLLKTIRRELESVLFDYNTVVQHFMDIQVQAIGAKALANSLKRQVNELQAQLTHYRSMLLGIKSFNNNDPIKSPTVTTLRSEFRVLLEKIQEEQNKQIEKERQDKFKAQDWNRKLRMEKDFMKLELQNQIEKWRRVSVYWEDKWRKTANDLHEAVTSGTTSDMLFEIASAHTTQIPGAASPAASSPRTSQHSNVPSTATLAVGAITESITDLVSSVKPFLSRSLSQPSAPSGATSSLVGGVGTGRGPVNPSSRLAAAASLRTPIAAGLPSNVTGVGAMGNTAVSKTSLRSRSMATSAIGTARSQALQAGVPGAVVTVASREAQSRANSSISSMAKSVDEALSESDRLKADVRRMLNR
ncbi:hypothetical protein BG000_001290 [Podila horticola]|nr:hypothetical protein BG000_001290 [Podila horticola]